MTEQPKFARAVVNVQGLKIGMTILSYVDFHPKYKNMDAETAKWVQINFPGSRAHVVREDKKVDIAVERIQAGDTLSRIHKIPPQLNKLTVVNDKLAQALNKRGFQKFEVKYQVKEKKAVSQKELKKQQDTAKANDFVQKIKENVQTHQNTSKAVENVMDDARNGKINYGAVKEYVDDITGAASAEAMSAMVSLKESDQTYDHCVDVGVIFNASYFGIKAKKGEDSIFKNDSEALLGAFLHDIGKSKIPKDVLDSTVRFERDSKEMQLMQSHPAMAVEILRSMSLSEDIVNMAHYHHVKMDTTINSCYPRGVSYDEVIYETRLISIIDVYQALVGKRKYKKSWNPPAAMRYLDALAGVEFDMDVWDDFLSIMGLYPKGSLVQLNDESLAFVMNISEDDPERPQVVVVRNASGEDITHHTLLDLVEEKEITIVKDLDCLEIFGTDAIDYFSKINIT